MGTSGAAGTAGTCLAIVSPKPPIGGAAGTAGRGAETGNVGKARLATVCVGETCGLEVASAPAMVVAAAVVTAFWLALPPIAVGAE